MKLKSFGCSFTYGSELALNVKKNDQLGQELSVSTWPSLIADHYQIAFENYAWPGVGNLRILEQAMSQAALDDPAFFVINWTWIDRFDYIDPLTEEWNTLRPGGNDPTHEIHYKHFYSQYHTMLTNASYILTAINTLRGKNISFCMTLMDTTLFDPIDPDWQDPYPLRILQQAIKPYITWFDDMNFLSWSRKNNYPVSELWHPLEEAHRAAANYMIKIFDTQKIIDPARPVHV